ncbi:MAG: class E sortase [Actinomycetota bacterium]|nr:class E sortase [Actinomycetota bacterium]
MPLTEKNRRARDRKRSGYAVFETGSGRVRKKRRRSRARFYVVLSATLVALGALGYLSWVLLDETDEEPSGQQQAAVEREAPEETDAEEEEAGGVAPEDPTLYLTVPRLGLYGHTVRNEHSEEALSLGAIKVPSTGFPWQKGDTNTYIACHRLGFPGTESFNQCLNLHSMQKGDEVILTDTNGTLYRYRVSEFLTIRPSDTWVMHPLSGRDVVSLQTCIEAPGDFATLGPNWEARFVVRADRVG